MRYDKDGLRPVHGKRIRCEGCEKEYSYFVWSFGSDLCLCRKCVNSRPSAYLDSIDVIDQEAELDIIYNEIEDQDRKDGIKETKSYGSDKRNTL